MESTNQMVIVGLGEVLWDMLPDGKKPLMLTEHGIYTREREEEIIRAKWVEQAFKPHWIDFNAGPIIEGNDLTDEMLELIDEYEYDDMDTYFNIYAITFE